MLIISEDFGLTSLFPFVVFFFFEVQYQSLWLIPLPCLVVHVKTCSKKKRMCKFMETFILIMLTSFFSLLLCFGSV